MKPDGSFAPTYYSRSFACGSGEDIPTGESLRGRMLVDKLRAGDIDLNVLTNAQKMATEGVFASVMSAYIKWLAPQIAHLKKSDEVKALYEAKRDEYINKLRESGAHERVPGALADLYIGFEFLMRFAHDVGVVTNEEIYEYTTRLETFLLELGEAQAQYTRAEEPTLQFIDLLSALLASKRAHICAVETGQEPYELAMALGWEEHTHTTSTGEDISEWRPRGPCIGWTDSTTLYLEPNIAYAEVQRLARDQGTSLPFTKQVLYGQLHDAKLLVSADGAQVTKLKKINGRPKRTLWLHRKTVLGSDDEPEEQGKLI